jgi:hypothetical protein
MGSKRHRCRQCASAFRGWESTPARSNNVDPQLKHESHESHHGVGGVTKDAGRVTHTKITPVLAIHGAKETMPSWESLRLLVPQEWSASCSASRSGKQLLTCMHSQKKGRRREGGVRRAAGEKGPAHISKSLLEEPPELPSHLIAVLALDPVAADVNLVAVNVHDVVLPSAQEVERVEGKLKLGGGACTEEEEQEQERFQCACGENERRRRRARGGVGLRPCPSPMKSVVTFLVSPFQPSCRLSTRSVLSTTSRRFLGFM